MPVLRAGGAEKAVQDRITHPWPPVQLDSAQPYSHMAATQSVQPTCSVLRCAACCAFSPIPVSQAEMPSGQAWLLLETTALYSNITLPSGVQGENAAEQDFPLGFFRCPSGQQLGTTKECSESHFPTRKPCRNLAPLQTSSVHSCRLMSTSSSLLLGLVEAPKAPWPCCCHRHVLFPTGADVLLAFHCPHGGTGPVVGGSLLPHPHGPSLAGQGAPGGTRCWYPVAAVPEEAEEEFTPVRAAGVCVNQTSYTSTAVLPAPMLGWQEHREASGQMRGGDGTCGAATATSSWVLTTGPLDPRVWGQPFQPLLNASG